MDDRNRLTHENFLVATQYEYCIHMPPSIHHTRGLSIDLYNSSMEWLVTQQVRVTSVYVYCGYFLSPSPCSL